MSKSHRTDPELARLLDIEKRIVEGGGKLRILSSIAWPRSAIDGFLQSWQSRNPKIPEVMITPPDGLTGVIDCMEDAMRQTPVDHPLGDVLWKTAWSYATGARMLQSVGTQAFSDRSIELYGRPDIKRKRQDWSDLDAAEFLLEKSGELLESNVIPDAEANITAEELARQLSARIDPLFIEDKIAVVVDPGLASKAAAGTKRVRLRGGAMFSSLDLDQLFEHEVMIHSATKLNGIHQPNLTVLGLGSPRTTRTQEGLATLAELMTGAMDLNRLRRIALRVRAVSMALAGADFIEIFKMFLDEGQSEEESAQSAARIFRGGDPKGGIAFTKDSTYITGLIEVSTFLRVAIRDGRPELIPLLFAGRMTLGDVVVLAPLMEQGIIQGPRYIPTWAQDLRRLTATLTYWAFTSFVDLKHLTLDVAIELDENPIEEVLIS
jgi:uncharacterized protein (TIGR02421 family)